MLKKSDLITEKLVHEGYMPSINLNPVSVEVYQQNFPLFA